jgi:hypothetical protein
VNGAFPKSWKQAQARMDAWLMMGTMAENITAMEFWAEGRSIS